MSGLTPFIVAVAGLAVWMAKVTKASSSRLSGKRVRKVSPSYGSSQPCRAGVWVKRSHRPLLRLRPRPSVRGSTTMSPYQGSRQVPA